MSARITFLLIPVVLLSLTGCSFLGSEEIDYRNSEITPTLEVPPDLIQPTDRNNLMLPGSKVGLNSNTGRYVETGSLNDDGARARIQQGEQDASLSVLVVDGFKPTWNRLHHQLSALGAAPTESRRDNDKGYLVVNTADLYAGLKRSQVPDRPTIGISMQGLGDPGNTRIELADEKGARDQGDQSRSILEIFLALLK